LGVGLRAACLCENETSKKFFRDPEVGVRQYGKKGEKEQSSNTVAGKIVV